MKMKKQQCKTTTMTGKKNDHKRPLKGMGLMLRALVPRGVPRGRDSSQSP